jgi:hypothetical protein
MTKILRKHGKVIMAVLGVGLMIGFGLQSVNTKGGPSFTRRPIGHIGTQAVYIEDKNQAAADWRMLAGDSQNPMSAMVFARVPDLPSRFGFDPSPQMRPAGELLGMSLISGIAQHLDLYFLLQEEAKQRGIITSPDELGTVMANELFVRDRNADLMSDRVTRLSPDAAGGQDNYDQLKGVISRFLPVLTLVREVEADAKATLPMWNHRQAEMQEVRVAIVEMAADRFKASAELPTPEQWQAQYDKYKDVIPQPSADATGLNFGYKLPDRVRVQYLRIPREKVLEAARAARLKHDSEVAAAGRFEADLDSEAASYYQTHPDEFTDLPTAPEPATKPTTSTSNPTESKSGPTTAPTTSVAATSPSTPATNPIAATRPASGAELARIWKQVPQVRERAILAVLVGPTDELTQKIQAAITERLNKDYRASQSSTAPAAGPTTGPSDGVASKAHLDDIALEIQKQFNVLPEVNQPGDWQDSAGLAKLPGIGNTFAGNNTFASVAIPATQPALGAVPLPPLPPLGTLQPSQPLRDPNQNVYVFRIVARDPSHTPPLKDVSVAVAADVQTAHMYQAALDAAKALLEASRKHGLSATAGLQNLPVITTPTPFMPYGEVPGYTASPQTSEILAAKIADLQTHASASEPRPMSVVELPGEKKVLVVQLIDLVSPLKPDSAYSTQLRSTHEEDAQMREFLIAAKYFSYDAVKARLQYVAESDK